MPTFAGGEAPGGYQSAKSDRLETSSPCHQQSDRSEGVPVCRLSTQPRWRSHDVSIRQTRDTDPMLFACWASVADAGST